MELLDKLRFAGTSLAAALSLASHEAVARDAQPSESCSAAAALTQERGSTAQQQLHQLLLVLAEARSAIRNDSVASEGTAGAISNSVDAPLIELRDAVARLTPDMENALHRLDAVALTLRYTIDDVADATPKTNGVLLSPEEIIAYAYKLRFTTFQSLGVLPGLPPAPQLDQLHASSLVHFHTEQARLAAAAEAARLEQERLQGRKAAALPAAAVVAAAPAVPTAPAPAAAPSFPSFDPSQMPAIPPNWQPGDPIPLPDNLPAGFTMPLLPAGWQPGDPVPLPPLLPPTAVAPAGAGDGRSDAEADKDAAASAPQEMALAFLLNADLQQEVSSSETDSSDED